MTVTKVSIKPRRVTLTADGVLTDFDFDFKIFAEGEVTVYVLDLSDVATLQVITTDYTVVFDSENETGTVTFLTPPTNLFKVLMISSVDYEQSTDIPKGGGFSEPVIEKAYDLLEIQIQQLRDDLDRAVTLSTTSPLTSVELPDPAVADAAIGWNPTGTGLVNNPPGISQVAVDTDATPGFLGATSGDGVLRTSGILTYVDGGDFVTIGLANANIDHDQLTNFSAAEHFTMLDEDAMGSNSDTQAATQQSIVAYVASQVATANEFIELTDTPANFTSASLQHVRVNAGETALEYVTLNAALVPITDGGGLYTATDVEGALAENRPLINANTAKVTNATHTVDVTGSGALTLDPVAITNKPAATVASGDLVVIADIDAANALKQVTAQSIADLGSGGSPLQILDEGGSLTAACTSIDFVGAGVTATNVGAAVTVTIAGGGGGTTLTYEVAQVAHGFSVNDWVYNTGGALTYALADASAAATAESIGIVSAVGGANTFTLQFGGRITGLTGLTAGEAHFLSETAGAITATAPSTTTAVIKPVLIADSTTTGFIFNMRGTTVTDSTSFTDSFVDGDLTAGVLTISHNLGRQYVQVQIFNNSEQLILPDDITLTDANTTTVDLTSFGTLTGTYHYVIMDSGATGSLGNTSYKASFVDADLTAGVLTVAHGLNQQYAQVQVFNNTDDLINPDGVTLTDANNLDVDISGFGTITGTWNVVVLAAGGTVSSTATDLSLAGQAAEDVAFFDGTNWVATSPVDRVVVGSFTRDISIASSTQAVTGVGFLPSSIHFYANVNSNAAMSVGFTDGVTDALIDNDHNQNAEWFVNRTNAIFLSMGAGNEYRGNVQSLDADGFTIDWTKFASPTGTATIKFIAYR